MSEHFGLAGAARQFKIDGKPVNPSTVFRWMREGVKVNGRRVKLGAIRLGRRLCTTSELIDKFRTELAEAEQVEVPVPSSNQECYEMTHQKRTPRQRQAALERADRELAAFGC